MALTPGEADRLLLFTQAELARSRRERGLRLNVPEATAFIADAVCEWARDGLSLPDVRARAARLLGPEDVLDEVPTLLTEVRVEARFDDGTRLVVVRNPFGVNAEASVSVQAPDPEYWIELHNTARTPIGISSHIHLAEVNPRIRLDRQRAYGMRAAVPTGETVWLEPDSRVRIGVVAIRGDRCMYGNTGLIEGSLDDADKRRTAIQALRECGYLDVDEGSEINSPQDADHAVHRLMERR